MSASRVTLFRDTYLDSVVQLSGTRRMRQVDGVRWASAAMATPANLDTLGSEGFDAAEWSGAGAGDLFIAVRGDSEAAVAAATAAGQEAMFAQGSSDAGGAVRSARSVREARELAPDSSVAVVSVPGDYAALEAHQALTAGLHVLLFSDNVSLEAEIELKERAAGMGLLVMGPGAGTAMLGGACLGFSNVVTPGPVAVVAAAGTGAQEAMTLLDRWGVGVSHVIGLGGRDMSAAVGGIMAREALAALRADDATEVVLLVSKPPDADVARSVLAAAAGKPVVAALIGLEPGSIEVPDGVELAGSLETGVVRALQAVGRTAPDPTEGLREAVAAAVEGLPAGRTQLRGLYSGGTLCYEALVILAGALGDVHSNTPVDKSLGLPAPEGAHTCLDLGEEEYTQGRPHPMIDPEARIEMLRDAGADPDVAVIVLDVVLGHGAHPDPAAELAPVCAGIIADGGPRVVVYVLGSDQDPQGLEAQRRTFAEAGCVVTATAARAALAAAAIAARDPEIVGRPV
ncbi:protein FdrA [Pseudonocardia sp.]|uniref:protein FdrA n=1 Tax=Pseudonocardia sp. TaxID=60912 RepID=UPI00261E01A8|nr:protein FdrA [Pseudonocardia sp.]